MKKILCYRKHKNAVLNRITIKYDICMGCQKGQSSYALSPNFAEILHYQMLEVTILSLIPMTIQTTINIEQLNENNSLSGQCILFLTLY